eukprot:289482-Chlamydomonas_euryale.AAC.3
MPGMPPPGIAPGGIMNGIMPGGMPGSIPGSAIIGMPGIMPGGMPANIGSMPGGSMPQGSGGGGGCGGFGVALLLDVPPADAVVGRAAAAAATPAAAITASAAPRPAAAVAAVMRGRSYLVIVRRAAAAPAILPAAFAAVAVLTAEPELGRDRLLVMRRGGRLCRRAVLRELRAPGVPGAGVASPCAGALFACRCDHVVVAASRACGFGCFATGGGAAGGRCAVGAAATVQPVHGLAHHLGLERLPGGHAAALTA